MFLQSDMILSVSVSICILFSGVSILSIQYVQIVLKYQETAKKIIS